MKKKYIHFFSLIFFIVSFTPTHGSIDCVLTQIDNQMPQTITFNLQQNMGHHRYCFSISPTTTLTLSLEENDRICIPEEINGSIEISIRHTKTTFKLANLYCIKYTTPLRKDPNTHELISPTIYEIKFFLGESPIYTYALPITWEIITKETQNSSIEIPFMMTINPFGKIILKPIEEISSSLTAADSSAKTARTQSMF